MTEIVIAILGSSAFAAIVTGTFNLISSKRKKKSAEEIERDAKLDGLTKGVQLLLLGEIERQADKYVTLGSISRKELKWFLETYETYHTVLKGNGYAEDMKNDVCKLPVEAE